MKQTWFSSDWHLGHKNIIKYDNRPFKSIQECDQTIIKNYHSLVKPEDDFYYLGDFTLGNFAEAESFLERMPGNKFFLKGNHDKKDTVRLYKKHGTYLGHMEEIKIEDQMIVICHYGLRVWNKSHRGSWHLYGHSHGSLPEHNKSFDVGVMLWNYKPVSFDQVRQKMDTLTFKAIDHHE